MTDGWTMTGVITVAIFLAAAGVIAAVLGAVALSRQDKPPAIVALLIAGATIVFGVALLALAPLSQDIRLSAETLRFGRDGEPDKLAISIGGDPSADELVVRRRQNDVFEGVQKQLLTFTGDKDGRVTLSTAPQDGAKIRAAVQVGDRFVGAQVITGADRVCVRDGDGEKCLRYDDALNALVEDGAGNARPGPQLERRGGVAVFALAPWGPQTRIYPLRHYAPDLSADTPDKAKDAWEATAGFFFRNPRGELLFLNFDANVTLRRGDAASKEQPAEPAGVLCVDGGQCQSSVKIRIFEVRFGDPPPRDRDIPWTPSRLGELRSLTATLTSDALTFDLDTPDQIVLTDRALKADFERWKSLVAEREGDPAAGGAPGGAAASLERGPALDLGAGEASASDFTKANSAVRFPSLGGDLIDSINESLFYQQAPLLVSDRGGEEARVRSGLTISLGGADSAIVRVDDLRRNLDWPPTLMAILVIGLGGLGALAATAALRQSSVIALALFAMLEFLLVLRVLVAISAAHVDPGVAANQAPADALYLLAAGPLALSLAFSSHARERPLSLLLHSVLCGLLTVAIYDAFARTGAAMLIAIGVIVAALAVLGWAFVRAPRLAAAVSRTPFARAVAAFFAKDNAWWTIWWLSALAVLVLRGVAALAGVQESVTVAGTRISLSVLYVPAIVVLFGFLLARWRTALTTGSPDDREAEDRSCSFAFWAALVLLCIVPVVVVRDSGAVIYALPIALVAAVLAWHRAPTEAAPATNLQRWMPTAIVAFGAVALVAALVGISATPSGGERDTSFWGLLALLVGGLTFAFAVVGRGVLSGWLWLVMIAFGALAALAGFVLAFAPGGALATDDALGLAERLAGPLVLLALGVGATLWLFVFRPRLSASLPAALLVCMILAVNVVPLTAPSASLERLEAIRKTDDKADDYQLLRELQGFSTNQLRMLALIDPNALSGVGTREAEGQSIAFAHMADHARRLWGQGYLEQDAPSRVGLMRFHMSDNVTAVHVMAPFGQLGAAAYLAVLFAGFLVLAAAAGRASAAAKAPASAQYIGTLSIGTLVLVSAYMVLGNLGAAPFTGRNAYLLAVESNSDFVEAMALFMMAAFFVGNWRGGDGKA